MTKLYVGNLSQDVTEKELRRLFDSFGDVDEVAVFRDKGFAFVHFHRQEDADTALDALDNSQFMGETILVQFSRTKGHGYGRGSGPPHPQGGRRGGPPPSYSRRDHSNYDSHHGDYRDRGGDGYRDSFRDRERGSRYGDSMSSRDYRGRDRYGGAGYYGDRYGGRYEHERGGYEKSSYDYGGSGKYAEYHGRSRSPGPRDGDRYHRDPYERSGYREEKRRW